MNREQIEGGADKAVGQFREKWGRITGSLDAEVHGLIDQIKGEARKERGRREEVRQKKEG